jgi:N6-adenosine-specific RNA methylase IME4
VENKLIKWDTMRTAVAECHSVDEITLIRNKAEAYRYALRQAKESPEVIRKAEEIKLRAERRAGELLKETIRKPEEGRPVEVSKGTTLIDMGISRDQSSKWQKIASIPEEKFENFLSVQKELSTSGILNFKKNLDRQERVETTETPRLEGKYKIIYADPPWKYGSDYQDKFGHARSHYSTMDQSELCDLPIKEVCMPDCVLFLWVTSPKLPEGLEVLRAWGFDYKTSFVWDKIKHNYGNYNSVRHEFLLIGGIGSSTPDVKKLHDSVISIERTNKHSEKPEYFRSLIDKLYPKGDRIELFARKNIEGWSTWGSELE